MKAKSYNKNTIPDKHSKKKGKTADGDSFNRWLFGRRQFIGAFFLIKTPRTKKEEKKGEDKPQAHHFPIVWSAARNPISKAKVNIG